MADPSKKSFFAELAAFGRSLVNLADAVRGGPMDAHEPEDDGPPSQLLLPGGNPNFENAQLLTEHTEGWHTPHPSSLAAPSYAPAMTAFGVVFIALGAVTTWPLSVIGALIFVFAIAKWIGELLHD